VSDSTPAVRGSGRRARTAALILLASAAFLAYAWLLLFHASFVAGGSDSSGYVNAARLITTGRVVAPVEAIEELGLPDEFARLFIPLGFLPGPRPATMVPFYPPGFPLHLALGGLVGGWNYGPFLVAPFAGLASLLLIYLVGRELGLSRLFSAAGAAILALCPIFVYLAEQPMSDVVATMWTLAAVLFALRSRRRDAWAVAAGASLGMAVLVRPTEFLLLAPLAFALRPRLRTAAIFAAGAAPFAVALLVWNRLAFGSPFRTGYAGLEEGLTLSAFPGHFLHYGEWLLKLLSPIIPVAWLLLAGDRKVTWRHRTLLFLWFALFFLFYCFWDVDGAWWYTRFLLPGIPALIAGSLLAVRDGLHLGGGGRSGILRPALAVAALAVVLAVEWNGILRLWVLKFGEGEKVYADASRLAEAKASPGALIVSMQLSGAIRYYTGLTIVRWDCIEEGQAGVLRQHARERGRPLYALLAPNEIEQVQGSVPGTWKKIGNVRHVTLFRWD
jgi:4-amino-4-deoxy-L-arabinose transferase-like glycosyltransferase